MEENLVPFIKEIERMSKVEQFEINGQQYTTKKLEHVPPPLAAKLNVFSLNSLVNFAKSKDIPNKEAVVINVEAMNVVRIYGVLNSARGRECLLEASIESPDIKIGKFIPAEDFNIMIQSQFMDDKEEIHNDKAKVLKITMAAADSTVREQGDNGISQEVVIKTGPVEKGWETVPNPCTLHPLCTFPEIPPPDTKYILRAQQGQNGVNYALFNASGKYAEYRVINEIKEYLRKTLGEGWIII